MFMDVTPNGLTMMEKKRRRLVIVGEKLAIVDVNYFVVFCANF